MTVPDPVPAREPGRRHRQAPAANTLVVVLGAIAGVLGVAGAVAVVLALTTVAAAADRAEQAAKDARAAVVTIQASRKEAALNTCLATENLKSGLRFILRNFDVDPAKLPPDPLTGRRPLERVEGGCTAYAQRVIQPKDNRP